MADFVRRSKHLTLLALVLIVGITVAVFGSSCSPDTASVKMEDLTIATPLNEINALLYIAEAQKFFAANGLQVTFKENYDSGATAAAGMLKGEAEIAAATEFLIMRQLFNKADLTTFATIDKYENTYLMWRTDIGIKTINDLKGKRVGVPLQTIADFYLGRTLELNGMNLEQITIVDVRATDSEKALVNREVDAVVTWEPFVTRINQNMAKDVSMSGIQSAQFAYWNLISTSDWKNNHPETIKRLVKSLVQAESYLASHEDQAKAIIQGRLNYDDQHMRNLWPQNNFSLSLEQSMILVMEEEARWLISNNLTTEKTVPNCMDNLYPDALKAVKPTSVRIAGK
ncbi:MAG: NrtA/SsuA/CpmA family ABC transporter substrate-binding protein [Dehalococcoidales bacterium]|nr:NrtA/SsuA/CpmA family ABC transporter substrate-binding protein [Dehalococcoidales bacterium]